MQFKNLCNGIDKLHSAGYIINDISIRDVKFDEKTNTITILNCDNISISCNEVYCGVLGVEGFIAPEIIQGQRTNKQSDLFSLAVILFCIWCKQNPFEGTAAVMYDGNDMLHDLYAHPIFIFHPKDKSNTVEKDPNGNWAKGLFDCVRARWNALPTILQEKFTFSFVDAVENPQQRISASSWARVFEELLKK